MPQTFWDLRTQSTTEREMDEPLNRKPGHGSQDSEDEDEDLDYYYYRLDNQNSFLQYRWIIWGLFSALMKTLRWILAVVANSTTMKTLNTPHMIACPQQRLKSISRILWTTQHWLFRYYCQLFESHVLLSTVYVDSSTRSQVATATKLVVPQKHQVTTAQFCEFHFSRIGQHLFLSLIDAGTSLLWSLRQLQVILCWLFKLLLTNSPIFVHCQAQRQVLKSQLWSYFLWILLGTILWASDQSRSFHP